MDHEFIIQQNAIAYNVYALRVYTTLIYDLNHTPSIGTYPDAAQTITLTIFKNNYYDIDSVYTLLFTKTCKLQSYEMRCGNDIRQTSAVRY